MSEVCLPVATPRHDSGCRTRMAMLPGVQGFAVFRGERDEHRLTLERWWGEPDAPYALWVGMNPSGAEADLDDLTIRKEAHWTRLLGLTRYVKANVGTYRWTQSGELRDIREPLVHPENLAGILGLAAAAQVIVLSTGMPPEPLVSTARTLFRELKLRGHKVDCLGVTNQGWPKHSSRLGYDTAFSRYSL